MTKPKIVILDGITLNSGDFPWEGLKQYANLAIYDRTNPQEIIARSRDAQALITNKVVLNKDILNQLPRLRYIGVSATGYNIVDVATAKAKGITVTNVPSYATMSVAQMAFAHILEFTHNIALHSASVRQGDWNKSLDFCYWKKPLIELSGLNLGIIGFGNSGKAVAKIAQSFGMNILILARKKENLQGYNNVKQVDLRSLFENSDFITLHCPLNEESKEIINSKNLSLMKPSSYIINIGRGGLVNEADLANALKNNIIAGAALDVLSCEPPKADNPLITIPNCNITPHIAWATYAARKRAFETVINNFISFLDDKIVNEVIVN